MHNTISWGEEPYDSGHWILGPTPQGPHQALEWPSDGTSANHAIFNGYYVDDFTLSAEITLNKGSAGIIFHFSSPEDYYVLRVDNGKLQFFRYKELSAEELFKLKHLSPNVDGRPEGNVGVDLEQNNMPWQSDNEFAYGRSFVLKVVANAGIFLFYVDSIYHGHGEIEDGSCLKGRIGLWAGPSSKACFKNVDLTTAAKVRYALF